MNFIRIIMVLCAVNYSGEVLAGVIFVGKELVTLEQTEGNAIYVENARIVEVGQLSQLAEEYPHAEVNLGFADNVIVPGLIEHHVHPFLAALTMSVDVIAIEDWALPTGMTYGVRTRDGYLKRLRMAVDQFDGSDDLYITWGFHHYFHGALSRADLDKISPNKPILVIHRSFHEFVMNSAALALLGISEDDIMSAEKSARKHMSIEKGHFAEQGAIAITGKVFPYLATPQRLIGGLKKTRRYLHENGVTMISNPGSFLSRDVQLAKNAVFGAAESPFRSLFIVNGMFIAEQFGTNDLIGKADEVSSWGEGKLSFLPKRVKLFTDGAIYSQAMQMRDGYLDGHSGAWLMEEDVYRTAFQTYWDAGYQIHVHQNGDAGLDRLLDVLEENLKRAPRADHRTVIVHFGYSRPDQVTRIKELGAIVSANPYYVTALSDLYTRKGVGPKSQEMVRLGDVSRAGISVSLHSDMPMAPGAPLFLMHQAINRVNFANKVAGPSQRLDAEQALRAVTINAAYTIGLEDDYGSIAPGKFANFTILAENPLVVAPDTIKNIKVISTVVEGVHYPIVN